MSPPNWGEITGGEIPLMAKSCGLVNMHAWNFFVNRPKPNVSPPGALSPIGGKLQGWGSEIPPTAKSCGLNSNAERAITTNVRSTCMHVFFFVSGPKFT